MAISQVQSESNTSTGTGTCSVTWASTTTAGNLLIVCAVANEVAGDVTFTSAPTGYTALAAGSINATGSVIGQMWYKIAAGSDANPSVTISASQDIAMAALEYTGNTATPLDVEAENSGTGTTPDSGTTGTTAQADELWIAFLGNRNSAQSSPTNSFTQQEQVISAHATGSNRARIGVYHRIVSATGTANTSSTIGASQGWVGQVATFKATVADNIYSVGVLAS